MSNNERTAEIIKRTLELHFRMRKHFQATSASFDLTPAEARTLHNLESPQPMGAIANILHCDASYVTMLTDRLEEAGLVERRADPADRRIKRLALTDLGIKTRIEFDKQIRKTTPVIAGLTDSQQNQFIGLLRSLDTSEDRSIPREAR